MLGGKHIAFVGTVGSGTTTALLNHLIENYGPVVPENMPVCTVFKVHDPCFGGVTHYFDQNYWNLEELRKLAKDCPESDRLVITCKVNRRIRYGVPQLNDEGGTLIVGNEWPEGWEVVFV